MTKSISPLINACEMDLDDGLGGAERPVKHKMPVDD